MDADVDPLLARFVDLVGAVVTEVPAAPELGWLTPHDWAWDPARLDELIRAAAPATLYVCGGADNQHEVADRVIQVFLLEIDEPTMLARLDARRDWGRIGGTREYLRRKLPALQGRLRARPVYHRKRDSIEAHLTIVFAAWPSPGSSSTAPAGPSRNSSAPPAATARSRSAPASTPSPPNGLVLSVDAVT